MLQRRWVDAASRATALRGAHVLGAVVFDAADCAIDGTLSLHVPLEVLDAKRSCIDLWTGATSVRNEQSGTLETATDGRRLFGFVRIDEAAAGGIRAAAVQAYAAIFAALERSPCPHPLRFWNYVPHINEPLDGLERYRHFNIGRQEAFLAAHRSAFAGAPAACAIGNCASVLTVYFIAADEAPVALENPRQVSAYHYPPEYGPRSPTFSRASLSAGNEPMLFVSGTASIVGHRSEHPGDPVAQTRETFANLSALVEGANARVGSARFALDRMVYTIYIRERADLARVREQFLVEVGRDSAAARHAVFLRGDVCRSELLVEIEAVGGAAL